MQKERKEKFNFRSYLHEELWRLEQDARIKTMKMFNLKMEFAKYKKEQNVSTTTLDTLNQLQGLYERLEVECRKHEALLFDELHPELKS